MGLAQGVTAFAQIFAPFTAGLLWRKFADGNFPLEWPLGQFLTWNVFGLIGLLAFGGSCWIRTPKIVVAENAGDNIEACTVGVDVD
jgi:hypothetical protein